MARGCVMSVWNCTEYHSTTSQSACATPVLARRLRPRLVHI